jgi:hypothetical protein
MTCERLDDHMTTLEERPVADIERAAKVALMGLRPAFERRWKWQRWATMAGALALGAGVMGVVITGIWNVAAAVTRQEARADNDRLQSWWNATCGDRSPNRIVIAGKPVCQVPMDQKGK